MRLITPVFFILVILVGATFACLNAAPVDIHYYVGTASVPLSLLLVFSFAIGILIGFFMGFVLYWRARCKNRRLNKRIKLAEKEINNIRSIPLKEDR
ncbi:MAG: uncharacterized protein K0R12_213 [Gammaproteobacteria bacterium]|jgi:putative membrane protein|nr:uncharacterized protein [Gammaproteobacteria bacterium]